MNQYGSPQYGLYSGYIKPALGYLQNMQGPPLQVQRTPVSERERMYGGIRTHPADVAGTREWAEENIMPSVIGSAGAFGNIRNPENIKTALDILSKFGVRNRNARILIRNTKKMLELVHPDKFAGQPEKIPTATKAFQELGWASEVIKANKGNLRVYGIF